MHDHFAHQKGDLRLLQDGNKRVCIAKGKCKPNLKHTRLALGPTHLPKGAERASQLLSDSVANLMYSLIEWTEQALAFGWMTMPQY